MFCALRERFFGEVATIQQAADDQVANCNATVTATMDALAEANQNTQDARSAAQAAAEAREAELTSLNAAVARLEQQVRLLHCPVPALAHTVVTAGDAAFGGAGITMECSPGFRDDAAGNTPSKRRFDPTVAR